MSNFTFRPSARENVHVIGGFIGGTGSGKTYSALRLATGLAGGKKFAVIDTEARRALHYAGTFSFDHGDLQPPFTPDAYLSAILAAEAAGYPVAVVDSMSHEHAGSGGILDWHEAELTRMAGDDYGKRERVKFAAWIKPKMAHKKMLTRLLQLRMHLILCFRAEPKMKAVKIIKDGREKTEYVDAGWLPICAKGLEFELTFSFLLRHEHPGLWRPDGQKDGYGEALKLPEDLRPLLPEGKPIDEACGQALAAWSAGGVAPSPAPPLAEVINEHQAADLDALIDEVGADKAKLLAWLKVASLDDIPASRYSDVVRRLEQKRASAPRAEVPR
jgi:hypothetical protein